jgi:hypothetical protein
MLTESQPAVAKLPGRVRSVGNLAASPVMALTALALSCIFLATARLRLDGYGLLNSLPWAYYLGLVGLPLASVLEWRRESSRPALVVAYVLAFLLLVWLTPYVLEGTPRFRTSYLSYGYVDPVARGQGLFPRLFVYHNWPLFSIAMAALKNAFAMSPLTLMAFFPTVIMVLYLGPLSALLLMTTDRQWPGPRERWLRLRGIWGADARWVIGLWLFVVFQWTNQDYFSPQALAFLFYLGLMAVLAHTALRRDGTFNAVSGAGTVVLFTLIVATHVLSGLIALFVIGGLTLTKQLRRPTLLLLCLLVFVAWQAYPAAPFYRFYGHRLLQTVFAAGDFLQTNVSGRISGSGEHLTVSRARVAVTAIVFMLGVLALAADVRPGLRAGWRRPRLLWRALAREQRFALAWLISTVLVGPVSVYGGEMLIRTELFSLPPLAILIASAMKRRWFVAVAAGTLTAMAPLHILTHYGNELYDYVSPGELAGYRFIAEHLAPAKIYGGFPGGGFLRSVSLRWRNSSVPGGSHVPNAVDFLQPNAHHWGRAPGGVYVAFGRGDTAAATLFYNKPRLIATMHRLIAHDPRFRAVYVTPDYSIYRWIPPTPRYAQARRAAYAAATSAGRRSGGGVTTAGGRTRKATRPTK